jgi:hypothetical protein
MASEGGFVGLQRVKDTWVGSRRLVAVVEGSWGEGSEDEAGQVGVAAAANVVGVPKIQNTKSLIGCVGWRQPKRRRRGQQKGS